MKLGVLLESVSGLTRHNPTANISAEIAEITSDSRHVKSGVIFVALMGSSTDGHKYVNSAIEAGASAIVIQEDRLGKLTLPETKIPILISKNTWQTLAALCSKFYGEPGHVLKLVGVTGTNGKTTVTHLIQSMLQHWNKPVGLIGTLGTKTGTTKKEYDNTGHTTPMAPELQKILASMRDEKQEYVVMEVSSHALEQHRTDGCDFRVAVLTNLTQDHLDYHKTMAQYRDAKALLFRNLAPDAFAVINLDSDEAQHFVDSVATGATVYTYSLANEKATVYAKDLDYSIDGASFKIVSPAGTQPVQLKIAGQFSVYNALAALAAGIALGIPLSTCIEAVELVKGVRGRFEVVSEKPYVIVDYAHTPDGLKNILSAARLVTPKEGRLLCVFGCGGDRDATKRPKMGHIAEELADILVVTSDNPRSEDPQQIITDVISGIQHFEAQRMIVNADRQQAIHQAIDLAQPNDIIVVAGKGHEDYQILADKTIHFDDREVVQNYMNDRKTASGVSS